MMPHQDDARGCHSRATGEREDDFIGHFMRQALRVFRFIFESFVEIVLARHSIISIAAHDDLRATQLHLTA